jgi:hypothetical protein
VTRTQLIEQNDALRTQLKGGAVLFSPGVWELDAQIRGRLLYRLSLYKTFDDDSEHDSGVFIFAGYTVCWRIEEFAGERSLNILLGHEVS